MAGRTIESDVMSAREAADYLGVSRSFMTEHVVELGGRKVGRLLKFRRSELDRYLDHQRVQAPVAAEQQPTPIRRVAKRHPSFLAKAIAEGRW